MELLPVWVEGLSPELVKRARDDLGETPEIQAEALLELRKMINDDPDFICPENDTFLIRFLRVKKYNAKKTFKTLRNYYEFKRKDPGLMTDKVKKIIDLGHILVSPLRALDGGLVANFQVGTLDFGKFSLEEYFSAAILCCEQYAEIEANQVCGNHIIVDYKGVSLKKIINMASPSFLTQIVQGLEDCWPHRINSFTIVNEPFYFNLLFNVIWPMFSKKMKERISLVGSNLSILHKKFPKECLPEKLGGFLGQEAHNEFRDKTIANQLEIERLKKYSFHRSQKPVKKLSSCGLEENTNFTQNNSTTVSNVVI
uniref:Alpha-tocopherol transfer protein-like protein n=1 Tax=Parasteatoda tepidariorum TaxID=114398 RepID=A0A2L2YIJ9_PARTP